MTTPEDLDKKIEALRAAHNKPVEKRPTSQYGMIVRFATEMVAAVAVGLAIGYYADEWLGTSPLFLILCLLLGSVAGFITIRRVNDQFAEELEKRNTSTKEMLDK